MGMGRELQPGIALGFHLSHVPGCLHGSMLVMLTNVSENCCHLSDSDHRGFISLLGKGAADHQCAILVDNSNKDRRVERSVVIVYETATDTDS